MEKRVDENCNKSRSCGRYQTLKKERDKGDRPFIDDDGTVHLIAHFPHHLPFGRDESLCRQF